MQTAVYLVKNPKFLKVPPPKMKGLKQESQLIIYTMFTFSEFIKQNYNSEMVLVCYDGAVCKERTAHVVLMLARGYSIPKSSVIPDTRLPAYYFSISTNFAAM